jgi:hypothetical protein
MMKGTAANSRRSEVTLKSKSGDRKNKPRWNSQRRDF